MDFKVAMTIGYSGIDQYIEQHKKEFARMGAEYIFQPCQNEDEIVTVGRDVDALITVSFMQPMTRELMGKLSRCKFIQSMGVGYESVDVQAATELGICIANVPDYCLEEVSDHAMALILTCSRRVVQTLGLIGLGRIPRTMVPKAKGFGLRVLAYDPYIPPNTAKEIGVDLVDLDQLLGESDFVSLHAALTDDSKHLMGRSEFDKMKPSAYFINTSRGPIVDEKALYDVLKAGNIAGAALDVTDPEPMAADNPMLKLDNVIITAHVGAISPDSWTEFWLRPIEEVGRIMNGEWPRCLVNPDVKEKYTQKWGPLK